MLWQIVINFVYTSMDLYIVAFYPEFHDMIDNIFGNNKPTGKSLAVKFSDGQNSLPENCFLF